ncbi:MAG: hypothetical protein ABIP48_01235 [Planctomycetota bacterium]
MKDRLEEAKTLKSSARAHRDFGDYAAAERDLMAAVELLRQEEARAQHRLDAIEVDSSLDSRGTRPSPTRYELQVAEQLADCYGSLGGVLRREGRFQEAIRQYDLGHALETSDRYRMVNTYNTVNRLVLRLLVAPELLGGATDVSAEQRRVVGDIDLREELSRAAELLTAQVDGVRREDPWALVDKVLVHALANRETEARQSLADLDRIEPPASAYRSALGVMESLAALKLPHARLLDEIAEHYRSRAQ